MREPRFHRKKCWPQFFRLVLEGRKTFEIRQETEPDEFLEGDDYVNNEFDPERKEYTGRETQHKMSGEQHDKTDMRMVQGSGQRRR